MGSFANSRRTAAQHYDAGTFTCGASLSYLLKLAHVLMQDRMTKAFAPHELSFAQWIALMKLREGNAATASDLCRSMHYDTGSITRLVDQLEKQGLLRRERSTRDRRVVALKLTGAGERKASALIPVAVSELNNAVQQFSKVELQELVHLLSKLVASLVEDAPDGLQAAAGFA